jgi:hypothetical protein
METQQSKTYTKGDVIVEDIRIGDIHYEYGYGCCIKSEVVTMPTATENQDGTKLWQWQSKRLSTGDIIDYAVSDKCAHYGPNLYTSEAYTGMRMI